MLTETRDPAHLIGEPLTLHRHAEEGPLGGFVYAQPFARYLSEAERTQRAVEDGYLDWWRNPSLAARLKRQMLGWPHGGRAYLAILAMDRDDMPLDMAAARCGESVMWLRRMLARFDDELRIYQRIRSYHRIAARRQYRRA